MKVSACDSMDSGHESALGLCSIQYCLKKACLILAVCISSGCTIAPGRGQDAADVFTIAMVKGGGVMAQVGPFFNGIGMANSLVGLEDGEVSGNKNFAHGVGELGFLYMSVKGNHGSERAAERHKEYELWDLFGLIPYSFDPSGHVFTKIEVTACLGIGLRVGFNPGELVDFILGFGGNDMMQDDLQPKATEDSSAQPPDGDAPIPEESNTEP